VTRRAYRGPTTATSSNDGAGPTDAYGPHLLPQHVAQLVASGISPERARERGYRSVTRVEDLAALHFASTQQRVPGLLIPIRTVTGEIGFYQYRPDEPRQNTKGKPVKYETPQGQRMTIDVPPSVRDLLQSPTTALLITEGVKKADAAVDQGFTCIALLGSGTGAEPTRTRG
jgi:Domain of unknown function (DUF3854)